MIPAHFLNSETAKEVVSVLEKSASSVFRRSIAVDGQTLTTTVDGQTLDFRDIAHSLTKLSPSLWEESAVGRITELQTGLQEAHHFIHDAPWHEAKRCLRIRIQTSPTTPGFDRPASPHLSYSVTAELQQSVVRVTPAMANRWNVDTNQLWANGLFGNQSHLTVVKTEVTFGSCSAIALSGTLCTTGKLTCLDRVLPNLPQHPVVSFPSSDTLLCYPNFGNLTPRQRAHHQEHLRHWKLGTRYGLSSSFFVWRGPFEVWPLANTATNMSNISKK